MCGVPSLGRTHREPDALWISHSCSPQAPLSSSSLCFCGPPCILTQRKIDKQMPCSPAFLLLSSKLTCEGTPSVSSGLAKEGLWTEALTWTSALPSVSPGILYPLNCLFSVLYNFFHVRKSFSLTCKYIWICHSKNFFSLIQPPCVFLSLFYLLFNQWNSASALLIY